MKETVPQFESTQSAKSALSGLNRTLWLVKDLAMVFPSSVSAGVSYRPVHDKKKQVFAPSLPAVIYAAFHHADDPAYYDAVSMAMSGKGRYTYDPKSKTLKPDTSINKDGGTAERLKKAAKFRNDIELDRVSTGHMDEAADIVARYLTSPDILTDDVGKTFEPDLIDMLEHSAPKNADFKLLDSLGKIKDNARAEYVRDLIFKYPLPDGTMVVADPERADRISEAEVMTYVACRIAENYGDNILSAAVSAEETGEMPTEKLLLKDAMAYVKDWVTDNGRIARKRERRTGENAAEYVPLIPEERNDLIGAPVVPENIIPMFAKDCSEFITKKMDDNMRNAGYALIATALGIDRKSGPEDINDFIRTELVPDTETAKAVRERAIGIVKKNLLDEKLSDLAANILRHVFQYKNDRTYSKLPSIAGSGVETRYRKTGVAVGHITSKMTDAFNPLKEKYVVIADEHPEINDIPGKSDRFTVDLDGIKETVSRSDTDTLHTYQRPALVSYNDPDTSYPIYAIWEGIVPFTKMVDNQTVYDMGESEETVEARRTSADEQIKGAMQSIRARGSIGSTGHDSDIASKPLDREELLAIARDIDAIDAKRDLIGGLVWSAMSDSEKTDIATRGMTPEQRAEFDNMNARSRGKVISSGKTKMSADERDKKLSELLDKMSDSDLRNYVLITAIQYYNGLISSYYSNIGDESDATLAQRDAFMYVMGDPDTLMTPMSSDDILERIAEKSIEYASARKAAGDVDEKTVQQVSAAYMTDFFNMVDKGDIPHILYETYGDDARSIARDLRDYTKDLLDAITKVVSGYGYSGLRMNSNYIGGKYSFNNRLSVSGASLDEPIGDFDETDKTHAARVAIIEHVLEKVGEGLRIALANPDTGARILRQVESEAKEDSLLDSEVTDSSIRSAMEVTDGNAEAASVAYGILRGVIGKNSFSRKLIRMIDNGIKPPVSQSKIDSTVNNLRKNADDKNGWFGKSIRLLGCIQSLSNGGSDFKAIRNMVGIANNEDDRMALGLLMSAVDSCRKTAERVGNLEPGLLERGFVDTGLRRNVGEPEVDLDKAGGEDELAGIAATEDESSNLNAAVTEKLEEWKPTPGYNTYRGLTGMVGFDAVRMGQSGDSEMAISLADKEAVTSGLSENAVIMCAVTIDDALNHWERLSADGEKGAFYIASKFAGAWADRLIVLASDYMFQRSPLEANVDSVDRDGKHVLDPDAAEGWLDMTKDVIKEIQLWCSDNTPAAAIDISDEIVSMLDSLGVRNATWEDISKVSTAFAHMILKLGEFTDTVPVPDPLKGVYDANPSIPEEVKKMAELRAMPGESTRGDVNSSESESASKFMRAVRDRMKGDSELAQLLSNLYETYGRNSTEGYADALDAMNAAAHAAGNKTDRAKTELKGGIAPTAFAASLYRLVWDAEESGDTKYSALTQAIESIGNGGSMTMPAAAVHGDKYGSDETVSVRFNSDGEIVKDEDADEPIVLSDIIHMAQLNGTVEYGPEKGNTYAGVASIGRDELKMPVDEVAESDGDIGRKLALALRMQMVDSLLSDRSFESLRDKPELWKQLSDRMCDDAADIDGTSSALLFVTLDHAILNVGREARQAELRKQMKESATLGEERLSDRMLRSSIGLESEREIDPKALASSIRDYIFGETKEKRDSGMENIRIMLGDGPAEAFGNSIDAKELRDDTSVRERPGLCMDLANELVSTYGHGAELDTQSGDRTDRTFIADVNILKNALIVAATGKPDANGHTLDDYKNVIVPKILGKDTSEAFFDGFSAQVPDSGEFDEHTLNMTISRYIYHLLHSPMAGTLFKNVDLTGKPESRLARWNLPRETGLPDAEGGSRSENLSLAERVMEYVEDELSKFEPEKFDDAGERGTLYRKLNKVGFDGSIADFCRMVKKGDATQDTLAYRFAHDENNYNPALFSKIRGRLGAFTPTKSHADSNLVLRVARGMERLGLGGIRMLQTDDGYELPLVKFSNYSEPRSLKSGYAERQLEMLMDAYKDRYGSDFVDNDGSVSEDNLRRLDALMREESIGYPIDPAVQTRELVPIVLSIMNNTSVTTGRPWGKVIGGTSGSHIFEREVTIDSNKFIAQVPEEFVVSIVRSIVRNGVDKIKSSDIAKELNDLRLYKKREDSEMLMTIANAVKSRIQARIVNLAKNMMKTGETNLSTGGLRITWVNPPVGKKGVKSKAKPSDTETTPAENQSTELQETEPVDDTVADEQ